ALQDLRYQGSHAEHRVGGPARRRRPGLQRHVAYRARPQAAPCLCRVLVRVPSRFTITSPVMTRAMPASSKSVGCSDKISQASNTVRPGTPGLDFPATVALMRRTTDSHSHQPSAEAITAI